MLAAHLGYVNVRRMLSEISVHDLRDWRAYYDLEPFGEERQDNRIASLVATIYNQWVKRGGTRMKIAEARVIYGQQEAPKTSSWESMKAMGRAIAGAAGAFKKKPRK